MADQLTREQALEIVQRMIGLNYVPYRLANNLHETMGTLQRTRPIRMEFEIMRAHGKAWDHNEVNQPNGEMA